MSHELLVEDSDYEELRREFDDRVVERFKKAVEKKQEELQWIDDFNKLTRRFHNFFGRGDVHVAELRFSMEGRRSFRGIFYSSPGLEKLPFIQLVEKNDTYKKSRQYVVIDEIFQNKDRVKREAMDKVLETA